MSASNPYDAPAAAIQPEATPAGRRGVGPVQCAVQGLAACTVGSFPLAALVALVFRFPIPFSGYSSGPKAMVPALVAAFFYGLLGGVVVQAIAGALGGLAAYALGRDDLLRHVLSVVLGLAAALPGLLLLAMLDWIIGPW